MYYTKFLRDSAFKKNKAAVIFRSFIMLFCIVFKISYVFRIRFGSGRFSFKFKPLARHMGGRGLFIYREKIEPLLEFGDRFVSVGDVCIDAGANQGMYSLAFASQVDRLGRVLAIEPMPYAQKIIRENAELNNFNNIEIIPKVLSYTEGDCVLDFSKGVASASIIRDFGGTDTLDVKSTTIDKIVELHNLHKLDFIKMDIEGAELHALMGAKCSLSRFKPVLSLECETRRFPEIYRYLKKFGYKSYLINENGNLYEISELTELALCVFFIFSGDLAVSENSRHREHAFID